MRVRGLIATTVALIVGLIGLAAVSATVHGFATGWLTPYWSSLREPQAALISGVATMYAAIFVATVVPVLFGGLVGELKKATNVAISDLKADTDVALHDLRDKFDELATQFRETVSRNREASDAIVAMVEDAKQSLNTLMHYQLAHIGLKRNYQQIDLPNSQNILRECHGTLEFICQAVLDQSRLRSQRSAFDGLWVGYKPFIEALKTRGLIDDERQRLMLRIADSRRYVRADAEPISLVDLNLVANAADDLKQWLENRREAQPLRGLAAPQTNGSAELRH